LDNIKNLKFVAEKINDFKLSGDFDQLCNLCGSSNGIEILPELEFLNNKEIKSFCLSLFCSSKECRNLSYYYFEPGANMGVPVSIADFTLLPKGVKLTCNKCGNQNIQVKVELSQSGFKYVTDLVTITLECACGNCAEHKFLGKYF
jgi:hypothetical protein